MVPAVTETTSSATASPRSTPRSGRRGSSPAHRTRPSGSRSTGGRLRIGDLKESTSGAHYYGISTVGFNLATNGCASVQLAQSPNLATTAYSMFAVVKDTNNLYRWYQSGDALVVEKKVAGVKTTLANLQYTPATHQFLRIRKVANAATGTQDVVFETASDNGGVPGAYTERFREHLGRRELPRPR